jgi:hypothetical protein
MGGGICDCGDTTVMNSNGFCKHHGPNRIPNKQIPSKFIRCVQTVLPRLILIHSIVLTTDDKSNNVECCICQNKDDQNPLGLVVRLINTGSKLFSQREKNELFFTSFTSSWTSRSQRYFE